MNKKKIGFMVTTGLFAVGILPGAIMDIVQPEMVVEVVQKLGLPLSLLTLIGVWKLLGIGALLMPKYRRLNEWAYAGFFFDLTGAAYVHAAAKDYGGIAPPLVFLALMFVSYRLRPQAEAQAEEKAERGDVALAAS